MSNHPFDIEKYRVVQELFVKAADEDYVISRFFYLNRLGRKFFWSAEQAIEKYIKASLLLNGYSINKKHNIFKLFESQQSFAANFVPDKLNPPQQIQHFLNHHKQDWGSSKTVDFVKRLDKHGNPSNRYNSFGVDMDWTDLFKLDQLVFYIRNLTVDLDMPSSWGRPIGQGDIDLSYRDILSQTLCNQFFPFDPKLVDSEKAPRALCVAAHESNFSFFPNSYTHTPLNDLGILLYSDTVSPLEAIYAPQLSKFFSPEIRDWIDKNIPFSRVDKQYLGITPPTPAAPPQSSHSPNSPAPRA